MRASSSSSTGRKLLALGGVAVLLVLAAVVLLWFQPQKLWIDDTVDEQAPAASATEAIVADGTFISRAHGTSGGARVLRLDDGSLVLRLEDLDTDNGPDLHVYLTSAAAGGDEGAFDDDVVELGRLKGNVGDQNYDVPGPTDLDRYRTVVIWCDRFDVAFGAADLTRGGRGGTRTPSPPSGTRRRSS